MMFFMPIMFAWITLGLPSGLTLYWTVSNILAVIQQYFVTGWGGLADWLPFLRSNQPALATVGGTSAPVRSASSEPAKATPTARTTSEITEKPAKRRKRRR